MNNAPPLAELIRRWVPPDGAGDLSRPGVSLHRAVEDGDDPMHILSYLAGLGCRVGSLAELQDAIVSLEGEEELSCFLVREGLAVTHASDGWWILFTE